MNAEIKAGSWWYYMGPGDGRGVKHRVVMADAYEVVTWSVLVGVISPGWTWLGNPMEFRTHFKPIQIPH